MTSPRDSDLCLHLLESLPTGIFAVDLLGKIAFLQHWGQMHNRLPEAGGDETAVQ